MNKKFCFAASIVLASIASCPLAFGQAKPRPIPLGAESVVESKPNVMFNGWKLTPAGRHVGVNSMPLKMAVSPDGATLAAVCSGRWNGLALIDLKTQETKQWVPLYRTFNGLAFSKDGKKIYVTGGNSDQLYVFEMNDGKVGEPKIIHLGEQPKGSKVDNFLTGVTVHPQTGKLYICNEGTSEIWVVDPDAGKVESKWRTPAHPYACAIGTDGRYLFVSNWGDRSVSAIELSTGEQALRISVGLRPNEMALAPDGRLFVACAGDNTVHVIQTTSPVDTDRDAHTNAKVPPPSDALEILSTSLYPSSPEGSTPDAVAVPPDGKSLFVANADNNDVMVADIASKDATRVVGFVPVGWYPSAIVTDGKKLFVANGKGLASPPSYPTRLPEDNVMRGVHFDPPLHTLQGSVSIIDAPNPEQLAAYTKQVRENSPYTPATLKASSQPNDSIIPSKVGDNANCPIKHVLYIIKENRTYDQVLGDMTDHNGKPIGDGEAKICMFGQNITPNQHALARDYVLLDHLYANGEVSVDGHAWCDLAIATDFVQKEWITHYTTHGNLPGNGETHTTLAGAIWSDCQRSNVSFMCYHEGSWAVPTSNRGTWNEKGRDLDKVDLWIKDLHKYEAAGEMPQFQIMWLGENHTHGTTPGAFTPESCVASNDIAVGKVVQAASQSKFWKDTAIFIVEDDSQNGPDHVDSHRTVGFVVSPYCKRGVVDSTPYTQMSMLRTMELILGLPPLTQYDAGATPMFSVFGKTATETPYTVVQPKVDLLAKNTAASPGAQASAKMDFDEPDEAPEDELNRILWLAVKGPEAPYPTPIHRAIFAN
jgi:YVTN family beta-propeller protein